MDESWQTKMAWRVTSWQVRLVRFDDRWAVLLGIGNNN
jgi:hypothetical protein